MKNVKAHEEQLIAVAATFTADPIQKSLSYWMRTIGIEAQIRFAPFNQILQELLNGDGLLSGNHRGVNVILLRFEDWGPVGDGAGQCNDDAWQTVIRGEVGTFLRLMQERASVSRVPWIVVCCPPSPSRLSKPRQKQFLADMERHVAQSLDGSTGIYVIGGADLLHDADGRDYYDETTDRIGRVPYSPKFFMSLGTAAARKIYALSAPPRKVIVLDCDDTIWSGICGEVGASGVVLDEPRQYLQKFVLRQIEKGFVVCLCSRNEEPDVWRVFDERPDMILRRTHIVAARINWAPKSENLKSLSEELGLGLDSFIFIDDNAVQCAEVQTRLPEVLTIQMPATAQEVATLLENVWAFDRLRITDEDRSRTQQYLLNAERERVRKMSSTLDDFIQALNVQVAVRTADQGELARIAQLTQRTNQFNFTLRRRSEAEVREIHRHGDYDVLSVSAKDRFGEYGLVGVVILQAGVKSLVIDTFLLSCRVFGRRIEHAMMVEAARVARRRGLSSVEILAARGERNRPARDFLDGLGLHWAGRDDAGGDKYTVSVSQLERVHDDNTLETEAA